MGSPLFLFMRSAEKSVFNLRYLSAACGAQPDTKSVRSVGIGASASTSKMQNLSKFALLATFVASCTIKIILFKNHWT